MSDNTNSAQGRIASIDLGRLEELAPQLRSAARQLRQYLKLAAGTAHWTDSQQSSACDEVARMIELARQAAPEAPTCQWPTCQPEAVQQQVADQAYRELYSGEPATTASASTELILPPLPEPTVKRFSYQGQRMEFVGYTAEQVRQAQRDATAAVELDLGLARLACEQLRTRLASADARIEELERTRQPAQSIEEDAKFQCYLFNYVAARMKLADGSGTKDEAIDAFRSLIAHIDGRTAGTAKEEAK